MKEKERSREREREGRGVAWDGYWKFSQLGPDQEKAAKTGRKLIKGKDMPYFENAQAYRGHWVVHPFMEGTCQDGKWTIAHHLIPSHGGKHTHQGGLVIFITQGKGYTVIDGVRHDWKAGDMMMLPIKKGGIEHQHFSLVEDGASKWVMLTPMDVWEALGMRTQQNEVWPGFKGDPRVPLYKSKNDPDGGEGK